MAFVLDLLRQAGDVLITAELAVVVVSALLLIASTALGRFSGQNAAADGASIVVGAAGSLHYAYQLYELDSGGTYELTLPMEFWADWDNGGLIRVPDREQVAPSVQALERSQVHPSAVFEIEDSGFVASYALNLALGAVIVLLLAVVILLVVILRLVWKRGRQSVPAQKSENGGSSHE